MVNQLTKFEEMKRKLYVLILPVIITALAISIFYSDDTHNFNNFAVPSLLVVYSISWFLIYMRKWFHYVEYFNVLLISVLHLLKFFDIVYNDMVVGQSISTGSATYWTPLVFAFVFVTLKSRSSVVYSFALWCLTLAIGLYYWIDIPYYARESLVHYFLSNFVYFIFLFFSRHIISAFTKAEMLEKIAYEDSLTSIANRRMVYLWLERALKKDQQFSIIFFDLDHFKRINDEHGHLIGDKALVEVTLLVKSMLKESDYFGRWGGEEFIILSFKRNKQETIDFAELLRKAIETHDFPGVDQVTSSFGVAVVHSTDTAETIVNRADDALYIAKNNGRNQVQYKEI
ncbi:GGDEF domain-containing protein [Metabacillus litoralis]|nr:GGDEF domain-containing protein [Metabacillus litoralis]